MVLLELLDTRVRGRRQVVSLVGRAAARDHPVGGRGGEAAPVRLLATPAGGRGRGGRLSAESDAWSSASSGPWSSRGRSARARPQRAAAAEPRPRLRPAPEAIAAQRVHRRPVRDDQGDVSRTIAVSEKHAAGIPAAAARHGRRRRARLPPAAHPGAAAHAPARLEHARGAEPGPRRGQDLHGHQPRHRHRGATRTRPRCWWTSTCASRASTGASASCPRSASRTACAARRS